MALIRRILNRFHTSGGDQHCQWLHVIQAPVLVSVLTSSITFIAMILLYRRLSLDDAGILTLVLALVQFLLIVASLGQPTLIQRLYSQPENSEFNWPRDLTISILISLPLNILAGILAYLIYQLSTLHTVLIITTAAFQIAVLTESRMLSSARHHVWANALLRIPNSLLIVPAIALLMINSNAAMTLVLASYAALTAAAALLGLALLLKFLPRGRREIIWKERFDGIIFLFTQSSYSLPEQGLIALGGMLLTTGQLAVYGAMAVILKPFDLLASVFRSVLTTELILQPEQKRAHITTSSWLVAILATLLALFFSPALMLRVYAANYQEGALLLPWLAVIGLFRLVEVLPRSYIIGNAELPVLRRFVLWQVLIGTLVLLMSWWVVRANGVIAIAWVMLLIQFSRFMVSSWGYRMMAAWPARSNTHGLSDK